MTEPPPGLIHLLGSPISHPWHLQTKHRPTKNSFVFHFIKIKNCINWLLSQATQVACVVLWCTVTVCFFWCLGLWSGLPEQTHHSAVQFSPPEPCTSAGSGTTQNSAALRWTSGEVCVHLTWSHKYPEYTYSRSYFNCIHIVYSHKAIYTI